MDGLTQTKEDGLKNTTKGEFITNKGSEEMSDGYEWEAEWKAVHVAHLFLTEGNPDQRARQLCYPRTGHEFYEVCRLLDGFGWRHRLDELREISAAWDHLVSVWEAVETVFKRETARGSETPKTNAALLRIDAHGYYETVAENIQIWMGEDISVEFMSEITGLDRDDIESIMLAQGDLITPHTLLLLARGLNKPLDAFFELPELFESSQSAHP